MENEKNIEVNIREKRYQWIIKILLVLLCFLSGVFFESERMKAQVVTNTVEIRILKETLYDIQMKLDRVLNER